MLQDDARKIAAAIEERVNTGATTGGNVTATAQAASSTPSGVPAGAGRPRFIRYQIEINDGRRVAILTLGQAEALLDEVKPSCGSDQLFAVIRAQNVAVHEVT